MLVDIRIQTEPFEVGATLSRVPEGVGAVASFIGHVRPENGLANLWLEHYPGMTEREIARHISEAGQLWPLLSVVVVHRVGCLKPGEAIVQVAVGAKHRHEAFAACEYLMDHIKTEAPFWKEERLANTSQWVNAKASDDAAKERWGSPKKTSL